MYQDLLWKLNSIQGGAIRTIPLVTLELLGMCFYSSTILPENKSKAIKFIQSMHKWNIAVVRILASIN